MPGADELRAWLRIPYVVGGRSPDGADCWGLARIVRRALRGDELPAFSAGAAGDAVALLGFAETDAPGDGALAFVGGSHGASLHVGIVLTVDGRCCVMDTAPAHGPRFQPRRYFERLFWDVRYYDNA